jgi:hypothetical protein
MLLSLGIVFDDDSQLVHDQEEAITEHTLRKVRKFSEYFSDLAIKSTSLLSLKPSVVALSCVLCARMVNKISPLWNSKFELMTNYSFHRDGVKACFEKLYMQYDENFRFDKEECSRDKKSVNSFITSKTPE